MNKITDFIRSQYENGDIDFTDAVASLIELGYDPLTAEAFVDTWLAEGMYGNPEFDRL